MNPELMPPRPRRTSYYPVGLGIALVVCVAILLIGVTGGFFFYVLVAAACIALLGLLHYAVWGHTAPAGLTTPNAWTRERDRENRH